MLAKARQTFISVPPQVATPTLSPPPPPFTYASTEDYRRFGMLAGSYLALPNPFTVVPSTIPRPPPFLFAREYPPLPHPGWIYITPSLSEFVNPYAQNQPIIARQPEFPIPAGSSLVQRGGIDSLPPNYFRPLTAREQERQPYPGSFTFLIGHVPAGSIIPIPPPALIVQQYQPPYPGSAMYRFGSGDLNPIAPGKPFISYQTEFRYYPGLLGGSIWLKAQYTDTLIQTPNRLIAQGQPQLPESGRFWYQHAPIDNGQKITPVIISRESERQPYAGFVYYDSGMPDNGIRTFPPLIVYEQERFPYPGSIMIFGCGISMGGAASTSATAASQGAAAIDQTPGNPDIDNFTINFVSIIDFTVKF